MKVWQKLITAGTVALLAACGSPTGGTTKHGGSGTSAPSKLFSDNAITTYVEGDTADGEVGMIQDMGQADDSIDVSAGPAKGTFKSYPSYWDGGIAWLMKPTGATGYYDLSNVKTIKFKIKSATIQPDELAFFLQWKSSTSGKGGEYTIPLDTKGVTDLTGWNQVSITLAETGGDVPDEISALRYNHALELFYTGSGSTHVDTPFAIKWYGSAGTESNTGPLSADENYQIGDIQFLNASGSAVAIASGIEWPDTSAPSAAASTPDVDAEDAVFLYNSGGTFTDSTIDTWQTGWSSAGSLTDDTSAVEGTTLKKLSFTSATGYVGVETGTANVIDITGKTTLNFDYWTPNGTALAVKVVDFGANGVWEADSSDNVETQVNVSSVTQGAWTHVSLDFSGLATTAHIAQLVLAANSGAEVQTYYLDNLYFSAPVAP